MDRARHEEVVQTFFTCNPQAVSDIFREFVMAMQAEETLPPSSQMAQNYETAAVNPEIHVLPGNLKDARDTIFPYFWGTDGWSSPLHLENVKGPANYASLVGALACLLKNPNLCTDTSHLFPSRYKVSKAAPITTKRIFDICQSTARESRGAKSGRLPYVPTLICDPSVGGRGGSADHPNAAWPQQHYLYNHLSTFIPTPFARLSESVGCPGPIGCCRGEAFREETTSVMRPPFEVADIIRAAGKSFFENNRSWLTICTLRCYPPLSVVGQQRSEAIGTAVLSVLM